MCLFSFPISLVSVCLQKEKALKCAVIWSILMARDNYFNFLIHPCWRQSCTPLKCCLGSYWCARIWRVCFASWLKVIKLLHQTNDYFLYYFRRTKSCTAHNQLQSINDNNLQADADNYYILVCQMLNTPSKIEQAIITTLLQLGNCRKKNNNEHHKFSVFELKSSALAELFQRTPLWQ